MVKVKIKIPRVNQTYKNKKGDKQETWKKMHITYGDGGPILMSRCISCWIKLSIAMFSNRVGTFINRS
jgi:hypothetical protein